VDCEVITMEFWATLLGAAVGVVAGAFIQYIVDFFVHMQTAKQQRRALKKEMQYDLQVVAEVAEECVQLRNAVNSDTLAIYWGTFNHGTALFTQSNALLASGTLYGWFSIDALKKLYKISTTLFITNANWVNNNVAQRRDAAKVGTLDKTEAVQFVNYVEKQINETRVLLNEFIALI
jgi:hypothetical protein